MALRKTLVLAVSAASILVSAAAFAADNTTDATAPDAGAKKGAQHATHKKGTHKKTKKAAAAPAANTTTAQ